MNQLHLITIDPAQCAGQPCLRGLRVRVKDVLELLAAGQSRATILAMYPYLQDGDITAALEYAALLVDYTFNQGDLKCPSTLNMPTPPASACC